MCLHGFLPSLRYPLFPCLIYVAALDSAASSLDQDANGHIFYADFVNLLLSRPPSRAPSAFPSGGKSCTGRQRATSAEPHTNGTRRNGTNYRSIRGIYRDGGSDNDNADDGNWGPYRNYPGASSRIHPKKRPVIGTGLSVEKRRPAGRDGSSPSLGRAAYSDGDGSNDDKREYSKSVTHGRARTGGRAAGNRAPQRLASRSAPSSSVAVAAAGAAARKGNIDFLKKSLSTASSSVSP